jgi:selenocysteine-specific elongation factor
VAARSWTGLRRGGVEVLTAYHAANPDLQGMPRDPLRIALSPRLPQPAFAAVLRKLAELGEVAISGAWVRLPGHEARFSPQQESLWRRVLPLVSGPERFRPPRVRDIAGTLRVPEVEVRRLLKLAARMGRVDEVAQDHFFLRVTMTEIVAIVDQLHEAAPAAGFAAAELRDRLANGRKVAIQILEFLDRHGVTLRRGDLRRINPLRRDLFCDSAVRKGLVPGGASGLQIREGP